MEIYLCRHGETEWSLSDQHTSRTDLPLTAQGVEQAAHLRSRLKSIRFEKVLSSPRKRALETCAGMHAEIEPLAVEWDYGDYEGLKTADIHQKNPNWNLFREGAPGGESPDQVGKRADLLLQKIRSCKGKVAVFSHGHFLRVLAVRFLGLEVEKGELFFLSVASLSILGYQQGRPGIILWNGP